MEKYELPQYARERLSAFQVQIESLNAQMTQFVDGVLVGAGIDMKNNSFGVDLETYTVEITPKEASQT